MITIAISFVAGAVLGVLAYSLIVKKNPAVATAVTDAATTAANTVKKV